MAELRLNDPTLLRTACLVGGEWIAADSEESVPVLNPATGAEIGAVPFFGTAETKRAIEAAEKALPAWRGLLAKERGRLLRRPYPL